MSQHLDRTTTDTTVVSGPQLAGGEGADQDDYDDAAFLPRRGDGRGAGRSATPSDNEAVAREKFGGINWGASFFGWLLAVVVAALLTVATAAVAAALGATPDLTPVGGTASLVAAAALLVLLLLGYYTGGYVAGRMSRFDGGRQGLGVWIFGLLVTALLAGLGYFAGRRYDVGGRLDLSPVSGLTEQVGWQTLVGAGLLVLAATLLAAVLGGSVGRRYHQRVDRVVHHP
jgi:hypothetical protein